MHYSDRYCVYTRPDVARLDIGHRKSPKPYPIGPSLPCLSIASLHSGIDFVRHIADLGASPSISDVDGNTALHAACRSNIDVREKIVFLLSIDRTLLAKPNERGVLPIHIASANRQPSGLKTLLPFLDQNVNATTIQGLTSLHICAHFGAIENLELLLRHPHIALNSKDINGDTPAHHAAFNRHFGAFVLLQKDCRIDRRIKNNEGNLAEDELPDQMKLFYILECLPAWELIDYLNEQDLERQDQQGNNLLHIACGSQIEGAGKVSMILDRNSSLLRQRNSERELPLHKAAANPDEQVLKNIMQASETSFVSVNSPNRKGMTPLHIAVVNKLYRNAEKLLNHRFTDVNARDINGNTPAHLAAQDEDAQMLDLLVSHEKYQNDIVNNDMKTVEQVNPLNAVLLYYVKVGKCTDIELLLQRGSKLICDSNMNTPLHLACESDIQKKEKIVLLVNYDKTQLHRHNREGLCPMHLVVKYGDVDAMQAMIDTNVCDINIRDKRNQTPLHYAVRYNRRRIVDVLLRYQHLDINARDIHGDTAAHLVIQLGRTALIESILLHPKLNASAKNIWGHGINLKTVTERGVTLLHSAARDGDANSAAQLIQLGSFIDAMEVDGSTPLHKAAVNGHIHVVDLLIISKCNVHATTTSGENALHMAAKKGYTDIASLLILSGISTNSQDSNGRTALHLATKKKCLGIIQLLIRYQDSDTLNINIQDNEGNTPTHLAAERNDVNIFNLLAGQDMFRQGLGIKNKKNETTFDVALKLEKSEILDALVKTDHCNSLLNQKNGNDRTVLHVAALTKNVNLVERILDLRNLDVDVNAKDKLCQTPLLSAVSQFHYDVAVAFLKSPHIDTNAVDREGNNLLHLANDGMVQSQEIVSIIYDRLVDVNQKNNKGDTPLHKSIQNGNKQLSNLLIQCKQFSFASTDANGETVFHLALSRGLLLSFLQHRKAGLNIRNKRGETLLISAAKMGNHGAVKHLLDYPNIDVNATDSQGHTAAFQALKNTHRAICETITSHKSYPRNVHEEYRMKEVPRGFALMINITKHRRGSDVDETTMERLLRFLEFEVVIQDLKDSTDETIIATLKNHAACKAIEKHDCLIVVIMAHGQKDEFHDVDDNSVRYDSILDIFNGEKCKALSGKPKLFLIQACRGTKEDIQQIERTARSNQDAEECDQFITIQDNYRQSFRKPKYADMLISYATWYGFKGYRNEASGSRYIQALDRVFHEHAKDKHLVELLTMVNEAMSVPERVVPKIIGNATTMTMQTPVYHSSLSKKLYFFPPR